MVKFKWDLQKEKINKLKHKIAFDEAASVFFDDKAIVEFDVDHSFSEERFKVIGFSMKANLLFVVFVEKDKNIIRIVSARKASSKERRKYEEKNR